MGRDGEGRRMGKRSRRKGRWEGEGWGIKTGVIGELNGMWRERGNT